MKCRMSRHDATHVAIAHPRLLSLLALAACVFCIYSVSVGHNFLFDEKSIIENNPYIKNLSLVPQLLNQGFFHYDGVPEFSWEHRYRPLTSLTFAADYAFWGLNPMGFNLTNTTLHLLVCVVLFMLLFKAFKSSAVAFLATLFYAVHPIHVEAITYIASRSDPLGTLLMLSAMWCYWNSRFKAGLLFYALGLFAKENIIFLPAYLLLMDICLMKRTWRHMFFGLAPYIAVATVFIALRASIVPIPLPPRPDFPGAIYRVMSMGPSVVSYLKCILFPSGFEFGKQIAFTESMFDPAVLISFIIYMLLLIIWALTWRKRIVFFGIGFFLVSLFPCLQWIAFTPVWAEHYLYIPLIGLIFVFGFFINIVLKSRNPLIRNTSLYVYLAFICFLSIKTYSRNDLYNSPLKFYQCLASGESPYAAHGLQFIGIHALDNERPKDAYELFRRAQSVKFMPTTENFLGISALRLGRHQDALQHFQTAYNSMQDEGYRLNMGVALMRMKQFDEATSLFLAAQAQVPSYGNVYENLLRVYELSGDPKTALDWGQRGLLLLEDKETQYLRLLTKMAGVTYRSESYDEMRRYLELILSKNPDAFWYSDVAKLLLGELSDDEFSIKLQIAYDSIGEIGEIYLLRSLVLRGDPVAIHSFFKLHLNLYKRYEDDSLSDQNMRREIEIAMAMIQRGVDARASQCFSVSDREGGN